MNITLIRARRFIAGIALVIVLLPGLAAGAPASALDNIQDKIAKFLKRPGIRSADWGIEIVDPVDDKVLLSVNADKTFLPASVVKVVTTATALEKLGPEFKFRTGVYTNGQILPDGTIEGDVVLVGRGDPNLLDPAGDLLAKPVLVQFREQLQSMGIKRIKGNVVGDDSYFDNKYGKGWTALDLKSRYGAPISALSMNDNVFWIHARPTAYNKRVVVSLEPQSSYFHIRNLGITGSKKTRRTMHARLVPGTRTIVVSGVLPSNRRGFAQYIILDKPAEAAAGIFKAQLEDNGIKVDGEIQVMHRGDMPEEARKNWKLLAEHQSAPLVRSLEVINKKSNNLHAEMLLRTL